MKKKDALKDIDLIELKPMVMSPRNLWRIRTWKKEVNSWKEEDAEGWVYYRVFNEWEEFLRRLRNLNRWRAWMIMVDGIPVGICDAEYRKSVDEYYGSYYIMLGARHQGYATKALIQLRKEIPQALMLEIKLGNLHSQRTAEKAGAKFYSTDTNMSVWIIS